MSRDRKAWDSGSIESAMANAAARRDQALRQGASLCEKCGGDGGIVDGAMCSTCNGSGLIIPVGGLRWPGESKSAAQTPKAEG